ncbi:MAG: MarR family winged helix-turn-helix transcriptional regulator [Proteobacteria bacterium]|nr:MarR family winged helix-turn-helix transcriptional regulator [Pseudomonadota bacterium]
MEKEPATKEELLYEAIQMTRPLLRHITAAIDTLSLEQGISVGQRAVLEGLLKSSPLTAPQLTQNLQLKRQFVARMLAEVKALGLVTVQANPLHKRSVYYLLSESGKSRITEIRRLEMDRVTDICKQFSEEQIIAYHHLQASLTNWFADTEIWKGEG